MVVRKEELRENKNFNLDEQSPFMILDTKHFQYFSDMERFGYCIEVLNVINSVTWVNKLYRDLNSSLHIKTEIFYEIIDCIFNARYFNDSQLERYYLAQQELEHFSTISHKLTDTDKNFDVPIIIDFIVLGIDIEKYESLADDLKTELQDEYVAMFCQIRAKEIEMEDFILKARTFVSRINELEPDTVEYEVSN